MSKSNKYSMKGIKMKTSPSKTWLSEIPKKCEVCGRPMGEFFIDGKVHDSGWALMCEECFEKFGDGYGIGKGQKYITKNGKGVEGFDE